MNHYLPSVDPPSEAPEHYTQTLSPVSPKPLRHPSPQTIPVLENMMDPIFNDTSTHANTSPTQAVTGDAAENRMEIETFQNPVDISNARLTPSVDYLNENSTEYQASRENDPPLPDEATHVPMSLPPTENLEWPDQASPYSPPPHQGLDNLVLSGETGENLSLPGFELSNPGECNPEPARQADADGGGDQMSTSNERIILETTDDSADPSTHHDTPGPSDLHMNDDTSRTPSLSQSLPNSSTLPPRPPKQDEEAAVSGFEAHRDAAAPSRESPLFNQTQTYPSEPAFQSIKVEPPPILTAGAPGTSMPAATDLPPPPGTGIPPTISIGSRGDQSVPSTPSLPNPEPSEGRSRGRRRKRDDDSPRDEDVQWGKDIQAAYDSFLEFENSYVKDGNWDRFPPLSRIFVGNLATEKVVKRDLFHYFHKHGRLAQISLKQAFGFIQFMDPHDAQRALRSLQGVPIRGKKVHLELCKPQPGQGNNSGDNKPSRNRRSRSPDSRRNSNRADRYRGDGRRDAYRPDRSRSPPSRLDDRHDTYRRARSPMHKRGRSPNKNFMDDLPELPDRMPHEVPDVQVIACDDLDGRFIRIVKESFEVQNLRCAVLRLSLLSYLAAADNNSTVMALQMQEGVQAVVKLDRANQASQRHNLLVFDQRNKMNARSRIEYAEFFNLDLTICTEIVSQLKQGGAQPFFESTPSNAAFNMPDYSTYRGNQVPQTAGTSVNDNDLQQILAALDQTAPRPSSQAINQTVHDQNTPLLGASVPVTATPPVGGNNPYQQTPYQQQYAQYQQQSYQYPNNPQSAQSNAFQTGGAMSGGPDLPQNGYSGWYQQMQPGQGQGQGQQPSVDLLKQLAQAGR